MNKGRKGFTLAEVLVTLAIIGVVAALTIPTLIQSTNNSKYATTLKKSVSVLNQALLSLQADGVTISTTSAYTDDTLAKVFATKLNVIKDDGNGVLWLADGTKLGFVGTTCTTTIPSSLDVSGTAACMVAIDVNGDKSPNRVTTADATGGITSQGDVYVLGITPSSITAVNGTAAKALPAATIFGGLTAGGAAISPLYIDTDVPLGASISAVTQ